VACEQAMLTLQSVKERLQVDWLISNLRWLLLVSVAAVSFIYTQTTSTGPIDPASLVPQIALLAAATIYNVVVVLLLASRILPRILPTVTLAIDTILTIGFVIFSGGLSSPLLFFTLFPILTAALRFPWGISLLVYAIAMTVCGLIGYIIAPPNTAVRDLLIFATSSLILLLATLVSGYAGDRVKKALARARWLQEETELRRLKAAQEHSRVIFELASTLSATLNYNKVLEAVLEVGEEGIRELGRPNPPHVSMVLLFSHSDMRIVAHRHLPPRDQNNTFQGKSGVLAEALTTAEPAVTNNPGEDPELGQLIVMHGCRQAIAVPLRAGFESFGAVVFGSPQPNVYKRDHQDLLMAICNQAIVALQNAQLYQSLMEEKERIVDVEEDARKKLARNLHDGPTQSIAAIAMRVNYTRMMLERDKDIEQTTEELTRIEELARRTTKEIRHMLFTLRPLILETQGLHAALEQYIAKLAETDPLAVHLETDPDLEQALDQNAQGVIFYIIEEAIGNARKHAKADNVWVRLHRQDNTFVAEVEDNGLGFDVDAVQKQYDQRGSLGMINMHERAELVGGKLSIASAPGEGTRITLTAPLQRR
jgi:signal transduction histidine kinase